MSARSFLARHARTPAGRLPGAPSPAELNAGRTPVHEDSGRLRRALLMLAYPLTERGYQAIAGELTDRDRERALTDDVRESVRR